MPAFNIPAIMDMVRAGVYDGLDETADSVAREARQRAPIRKVFKERKGYRRKFRALTPVEKARAIRRAQIFYASDPFKARAVSAHIQNYGRAELRRNGSANSLARSRTLRNLGTIKGGRFSPRVDATQVISRARGRVGYNSDMLNPLLTARGRYEVKSGRAIAKIPLPGGGTRVQIGGKLKASIESEGVRQTGQGMAVKVTAGIGYAKFVEFPTVRTAAQPFLIPAMQDHRKALVKNVAAGVRKSLRG